MNFQSILIILLLIAAFAGAMVFINKNGGWNSEGSCHGDCASCHSRCEDEKK